MITTATYTQQSIYPIATTTYVTTATSVIQSQSFVPVNPGGRQCEIYYFEFNGTSGERIQGTVTASQPIDFFIMTATQEASLLAPGSFCDPNAVDLQGGGAIVSQYKITSYTIDWSPLTDGTYYFITENTPSSTSNSITLVAGTQVTQTVSSVIQGTTTNQVMITATESVTAISTGTTEQGTQSGMSLNMSTTLGIVFSWSSSSSLQVFYSGFGRREEKVVGPIPNT